MKTAILASSLLISGLVAIPLSSTAAQPLSMVVTFAPNPPRQGTETIVVQLRNGSQKPIDNAKVLIASSMPSMSMTGPSVQAQSEGHGRYVASVKLNCATRWAFTVSAQAKGTSATRTLVEDVK